MHTHSVLLRIVALSLLLYSLWLFASSLAKLSDAESLLAQKQAALAALHEENLSLQAKLRSVESGQGIEELARERLGLVMPGERIFYFTKDSAETR